MPDHKIRLSQAITTFSPGAMVDLPEDSVIVGGLDGWQYDRNEPEPIIREARLAQRIGAILEEKIQWVRPKLVCEIEYAELTDDEQLRQTTFLGWRDDKKPKEVVLERT